MTVTEPFPLREARLELQDYDLHRDLYERRERVHYLTQMGKTAEEIAEELGLASRSVVRHRIAPPAPQPTRLYDSSTVTDERAADLEDGADLALRLAAVLRDEDPALVWGSLIRLDRRKLQELCVIALCAIPVQMTREQLLGWVRPLAGEAS
ncbi:hypothetical protein [Mycobacterium sp. 23]|uniref:hypothetical protein n=1 Tax=Mycobacterium sp. 23 TaxID=3400424 RepID=UPI003AAE7559